MRIISAAFLSVICLLTALPASGEDAPLAPITSAEHLDRYFSELKRTRDPVAAGDLTARIWAVWSDSGSATVNLLMKWATDAMKEQRFPAALDFLDQAIALKPDYAEAWNKRATLHYHTGNYKKSMEDIAHVLTLEPRHFGALSGMATILEDTGKDKQALNVWERLLEVYPADRDSQNHVKALSEKLAGSKT
jgi:tetratricopeptide (TPR) repeat protein